jgi:flagellar FliL protein
MADKNKEEQTEKEVTGNKNLFIIFTAVALVVIIGVGVGAYFAGARTAASTQAAEPAAKTEKAKPAPVVGNKVDELGPLVPINEFLINLLDKDNSRYLKATMTLEVDSEETAEEIKTRMPQIRDAILLLTSNKTYVELQDLQGKMQLRAELIGQLNTLLTKGRVQHIYITNFVIQ